MDNPFARMVDELRVPPHSTEAEQAVLGGLMLAPGSYDRIADRLSDTDFYRYDHRLIYAAIRALAEKNQPYDAVTIGERFEAMGLSEQVAGGAYLIELATTTPSAANIVAYAAIVRDKAILRKLIDVGTQCVGVGFQPNGRDTADILAEAEAAVMAVGRESKTEIESGIEGLRRTITELERRRKLGRNDLLGVTTSLDAVDELTAGLQDSDLIIVAARPSMGKTAMMLQMDRAAAMCNRRPYTIELEMASTQVFMRRIAALARVDFAIVQRPARASNDEMERIKRAIQQLRSLEWWLDDSAGLNVDKIVARIRRMKAQHDIGIAFVDYLQYIDISADSRNGITAAIQTVTRKLKGCAKELKIPIVLLSQLNRALEQRRDKRPMLSDLRESGAIEQDADVVMFLHRQGYYEHDWAKDDPRHNLAEVIVAKVRNGQTGAVNVQWQGRYQQFNNLAADDPANLWNPGMMSSKGGFEPLPMAGMVKPVHAYNEPADHDD